MNKQYDINAKENEQLLYTKLDESIKKIKDYSINNIQYDKIKIINKTFSGIIKYFIKKKIGKLIEIYLNQYNSSLKLITEEQITVNENLIKLLKIKENKINELEEEKNINNELYSTQLLNYIKQRLNITCDLRLLETNSIDYFEFENKFRGSRSAIKESQRYYVNYYNNSGGKVLDIGCGRGEFLELLKENNIPAIGIDMYKPFVEYCNNLGFEAIYSDALTFINGLEDNSLSGIFMSQVIEHLSSDYAVSLIKTAYKKLIKGSYFILETPNPQNLSTYWNFYLDNTHIKPVHYLALLNIFQESNYESIQRYENEFSKCPFQVPKLEASNITNIEEFNNSLNYINKNVFGYYDYTLIAKK